MTPKTRNRTTTSTLLITSLAGDFTGGWFLTLLLGDLHGNVTAAVPLLGYWTCFWLVFLAGSLFGLFIYGITARLTQQVESLLEIERALKGES